MVCQPRSSCRLLRKLRRPQLPLRSSIGGLGGVRGRKVPLRRPSVLLDRHHPHSASVQCEHPAASRTSGAGSLSLRKPGSRTSRQPRLLRSAPRYGYAVSSPAAIPPHLCRGKPRQKCSGQPGGSRSGCWRRQCRNKPATDCAGASMPGSMRCRERRAAIWASEPSRLSPVRPSVHPSRPVSSAPLLRPDGLRSIPLLSPAAPHDARPPPRTRSTSFRALWHCQTLSRHPQSPRTPSWRLRDWTAP